MKSIVCKGLREFPGKEKENANERENPQITAIKHECIYCVPLVSGLNIDQSYKLLMLISKCHLAVNVNTENEKTLNCHSGMLLSRINSSGTNLNRLCLARRVNHTDVVHNPVAVTRPKPLDPS